MKILVFSDSHGNLANCFEVLKKTFKSVSYVIHLGDYIKDVDSLKTAYPELEFINVCGNCDFGTNLFSEKLIVLGDKRIFITHGHRYNVKRNLVNLSYVAEEQRADICLFGHTHIPIITNENDIVFMNPGSISQPRSINVCSYGIIEICDDGKIIPSVIGLYRDVYKKINFY